MTTNEILKEVNNIFIDVLDNENIQLVPETTANDIEEWDSLNHLQLVFAMEKHFKIKFSNFEIHNWKNIGQICEMIQAKKTA